MQKQNISINHFSIIGYAMHFQHACCAWLASSSAVLRAPMMWNNQNLGCQQGNVVEVMGRKMAQNVPACSGKRFALLCPSSQHQKKTTKDLIQYQSMGFLWYTQHINRSYHHLVNIIHQLRCRLKKTTHINYTKHKNYNGIIHRYFFIIICLL